MVLIFALILAAVVLGAWIRIYRLQRDVWLARIQIRNRDRERQTVFNFLNEIGTRITRRLDLDQTLEMVVDFCCKATRADAGAIFLVDPKDPKVLQARVVRGLFPPLHEVSTEKVISRRKYLAEYVKRERLRMGEGIIGHCAQKGEAILIPDARVDSRVPRSASDLVPLEGLILAPLAVRGSVLGVLVLINKRDESRPGETFSTVDQDLVTALADQAAVTLDIVRLYHELAEKQRMQQELELAHEFQTLLLPSETPDFPQIDLFGFSQPALEVGGDYYDFIQVDDEHLGIIVADVSGKGIPGALVMATLRSTLRAYAPGNHSPRDVLRRVNSVLTHDTKENVFVSATYGILSLSTGRFRFARAGHEPTVCFRSDTPQVALHEPGGLVLGMIDGEMFDVLEEEELDLSTCGAMLLYTDGVPEAMNASAEEYGLDRFHNVLLKHAEEPSETVVTSLLEDILRFTRGIPQHDDITLVVIRWKGQDHAAIETAPGTLHARHG